MVIFTLPTKSAQGAIAEVEEVIEMRKKLYEEHLYHEDCGVNFEVRDMTEELEAAQNMLMLALKV